MALIQFGFSLMRSMNAIMREKMIDLAIPDLGKIFASATNPQDFTKQLAAHRFALACHQEMLTTRRVDTIILGQDGFRYGIFFSLFLIAAIVAGIMMTSDQKKAQDTAAIKALLDMEKNLGQLTTSIQLIVRNRRSDKAIGNREQAKCNI